MAQVIEREVQALFSEHTDSLGSSQRAQNP